MLPLSSEIEKGTVVGALVKAHDSKRFRLRAVSHEGDIYERFFNKSIASKVSWVQLGMATFVMLAQVVVMIKLMDNYQYSSSGTCIGGGVWSSIFTALASILTIWASRKPSYGKLHAAMAFHIISLFLQMISTTILFIVGIPELRRSVRMVQTDNFSDRFEYISNYYVDSSSGRIYPNYDTYQSSMSDPSYTESPILREKYQTDKAEFYTTFHSAMVVSSMMGVVGIIQMLMSFFMSLSSGRAICCGRTHLEGKFLEMEAVGREGAILNFRAAAKEKQSAQVHDVDTESISGPPPYSAELFGSSSK